MNIKASLTEEVISQNRLERALTYLATTDEKSARLKVEVERKHYLLELARKKGFLATEGNVELRKATAEASEAVQEAVGAHLDAMLEYERVKAKRLTEALIIDTWRTLEASRRVGNV